MCAAGASTGLHAHVPRITQCHERPLRGHCEAGGAFIAPQVCSATRQLHHIIHARPRETSLWRWMRFPRLLEFCTSPTAAYLAAMVSMQIKLGSATARGCSLRSSAAIIKQAPNFERYHDPTVQRVWFRRIDCRDLGGQRYTCNCSHSLECPGCFRWCLGPWSCAAWNE